LAPIPSAITREGGVHATRLFFLLPVLVLFSSFGLLQISNIKKEILKKITFLLTFGLFLFCIGSYLFNYYLIYPFESFSSWHFGRKELVEEAFLAKKDFEKVEFVFPEKEILQFVLFFGKVDILEFQKNGLAENFCLGDTGSGIILSKKEMESFDCKTLFAGNSEEIKNLIKKNKLPNHLSIYKEIKNPLGEVEYYLIYNKCINDKKSI
jgi:hypothetical protein